MKKLVFGLLVMISGGLYAQFDRLQTQYMYNAFTVNPAIAGEQGYMSATMSYRRQWWGFDGAPETFVASLDSPIKNRHHNIGTVLMCDRIGVMTQTAFSFGYTYRITGKKSFFAAGLAPFIVFTKMAWSEIQSVQQDAVFSGTNRRLQPGIAFGLYFHSEHFFAGLSGSAVSSDDAVQGAPKQPYHLYTGFRFGDKEKLHFTFSTLMRYVSPDFYQADINGICMFRNRIGGGLSWRINESVAGMLSFRINKQFVLGYAYDFGISQLTRYNSGSHEVMLRYDFGYTVNATSPR